MLQFVVMGYDAPDALAHRMDVRPRHFESIKANLVPKGNLIKGGALLNAEGQMIGSCSMLQFETQAEFDHWYATEPYIVEKVWQRIEVYPFKLANL
jgi:uncharacterized protein